MEHYRIYQRADRAGRFGLSQGIVERLFEPCDGRIRSSVGGSRSETPSSVLVVGGRAVTLICDLALRIRLIMA